jgi:CRISPR/Cas system CSM-associated protein Csm4 (group 5 of RAMP superfamily)
LFVLFVAILFFTYLFISDFLRNLNYDITLPDIPPHEDKITYPKSKGSQTNREKKREARIEMKHKQKRLKKEKYTNDPDFSKVQEGEKKRQKVDSNTAEKVQNTPTSESEEKLKNGEGNANAVEGKVFCTSNTNQTNTS